MEWFRLLNCLQQSQKADTAVKVTGSYLAGDETKVSRDGTQKRAMEGIAYTLNLQLIGNTRFWLELHMMYVYRK